MSLGIFNKADILKGFDASLPFVTIIAKYWEPVLPIRPRPQTLESYLFDLRLSEACAKKISKAKSIEKWSKDWGSMKYDNKKIYDKMDSIILQIHWIPFEDWKPYCKLRSWDFSIIDNWDYMPTLTRA